MPDDAEGSSASRPSLSDRATAALAAITAAGFLVVLAVEFRHGFYLTDESFSILDAAHPEDQFSAVRFHWLVTRPVLALSLGDLWLNRIWGVAILALAGWLMGSTFDRTRGSSDRPSRTVAGGVGAVCMLAFYAFDLRSPSYNWGAVLGASLVVACLAGAAGSARGVRWLVVGGVAASVTAASKISTGAAIAVLGLVVSPWLGSLGWRGSLRSVGGWSLGVALGAIASFATLRWWGDPVAAFERGMQVLEHIRLYDDLAGRTLKESLLFVRLWFSGAWPLLAASAVLGLAAMVAARSKEGVAAGLVPWALPASLGAMLVWKPAAWTEVDVWGRVSLVAFTALASTWLAVGGTSLRTSGLAPRMHSMRAMILLVAIATAFATAVGTGNAMFWRSAGMAGGIWLTAASALALGVGGGRRAIGSARIAAVVGASIVAFGTFAAMRSQPYRPLAGNAEAARDVEIAPGRGRLLVDGRLATAIETLRDEASEAGFLPGQDVLALYDMPGVVLALGGRAPGASWILSGYRGCGPAAEVVLGSVEPKRLADAWVMLRSPQRAEGWTRPGANPDVSEVLAAVGLDFPGEYEQVAAVPLPFYDQVATVSLWRPRGAAAASP